MARVGLRPAGFDDLGLRHAFSDRLLPGLVAAMTFLAALALAGAVAAAGLAAHWRTTAGSVLTVQVPEPDAAATAGRTLAPAPITPISTRADAVALILRRTAGVALARRLGAEELESLLRPWLGVGAQALGLPLQAVFEVHLAVPPLDLTALAAQLTAVAPGTMTEQNGMWMARVALLAESLQACAAVALLLVIGIAVAVVAVATRAGLASRREAIAVVHGLGATDGYIASRFAGRATLLAGIGAALGALAALPVLLGLAALAAPFSPATAAAPRAAPFATLPTALWLALPGLPAAAAAIGWLTAQGTVRSWLRGLL